MSPGARRPTAVKAWAFSWLSSAMCKPIEVESVLLWGKRNRQRGQAAQSEILAPHQWSGLEPHVVQSLQHGGECDLTFDPRQRSSKAEVCCPAEGDVSIVFAGQIKPVRIGKSFGITIGGSHHGQDGLPFGNLLAAYLNVLGRQDR